MVSHHQKYEKLVERIIPFCENREDIRAVLIVGSRARQDNAADEWSDLDLVLFSTDPEKYLASEGWVKEIGSYWLSFVEETAVGGGKERRVLFEDALDVDFSVFTSYYFNQLIEQEETQDILRRGFRVLVDKDNLFEDLPEEDEQSVDQSDPLPTDYEWTEIIHDFWYHAVWGAKKLLRGEWWTAKVCIDHDLKQLLLRMTEIHTRAMYGEMSDTWHNGRFFDQWADPEIRKELRNCFAHYDARDMKRALIHTMHLFGQVAKDTAQRIGYDYPEQADSKAMDWVCKQLTWNG